MTSKPVRKAVIAAAGFGTRFLPQTKAMPKEMLPLIDKPIIQYVVEELVAVGVEDIVIVTGYTKRAIEDHFDKPNADLVSNLRAGGKSKSGMLEEINNISEMANFVYVRQKGRYGSATPILNAEHLIGDEPFFFTYSDDFILAEPSRFAQMIEAYNTYNCPVVSTVSVTKDEDYDRYGIVDGNPQGNGIIDVKTIAEKPGKAAAKSDMATVSGFLATPEIFNYLHKAKAALKQDEEFYAVSGLEKMIDDGKKVVALKIRNGKYYDAGNKLEYLKTVVDFALRRDDIGKQFREYLKSIM